MISRRGFTLVETLIVVVILAAVVLLGYPRVRAGLMKNDLRAARTTLANLFSLARTTATQTSRSTWVMLNGNSAYVLARPRRVAAAGSDADTVGGVHNLSTSYQVTLTKPAGVDSIRFFPTGFGEFNAAGTTLRLTRGGYSDSVVVDGFGRVRK